MAGFTRRHFLGSLISAGLLLALPEGLPAAVRPRGTRTLVLLHLVGGNDGLNTVVPYADPLYRKLRPTLAVTEAEVLRLDSRLGFHPALGGFKRLFDTGRMAVVLGTGYADPSLSHFRSTEIWYGATQRLVREGWLGRYVDSRPSQSLRSVAMGSAAPFSLLGRDGPPATVSSFERFALPPGVAGLRQIYEAASRQPGLEGAVARSALSSLKVASRLASLHPHGDLGTSRLARDLQRTLALLDSCPEVEIAALAMDGFDTHVNQRDMHRSLLGDLGNSLAAFQDEVERRGLGERVLTLVFSEFGRRPAENSGGGTDHGTSGPVFLLGRGVRPGLHGEQPRLDALDDGNLKHAVDFRRIYAAVLQHWFGADFHPIVGDHTPLPVL